MTDPHSVVEVEMNRLRGRLLGFVEACGLPSQQERGMKQLIKSLSYDSEQRIQNAVSSPPSAE